MSGAGREATEETHYSSAAENVNAYKVEGHRHSAEIEQELWPRRFSFVTHLVPLDQGILATCYLTPFRGLTEDEAARATTGRPTPPSPSWTWWTSRRTRATCRTRTAAGCT